MILERKLNVLIVDDSLIFSQGLAVLLEQYPTIVNSVEIAHTYQKTLEFLSKKKLDILILDINFESQDYTGFTIAKKVKELYPTVKILILTQQAKVEHYNTLFKEIKVDGYLDKQLGIEDTLGALRSVINGEVYVDKNIKAMLEIGKWMDISNREKEIIGLLSEGLTQKEIASKLFISSRTVETHVKNLTEKLTAKNTAHLVSIYISYKKANRENGR